MKYYLINNKIMKGSEMPTLQTIPKFTLLDEEIIIWKTSLQPCEISESELNKIYTHLSIVITDVCLRDYIKTPIDVTDIIKKEYEYTLPDMIEKEIIKFKQPKQVDVEIEAVELLKLIKTSLYKSAKKTQIENGFEINIQFEEQAKALIKEFNIIPRNI